MLLNLQLLLSSSQASAVASGFGDTSIAETAPAVARQAAVQSLWQMDRTDAVAQPDQLSRAL
jgi:hypothetical protein